VRFSDSLEGSAVLNYTWGEQEVSGSDSEPADRIPPLSGRLELSHDAGGAYRLDNWIRFAAGQDRLSARDLRDSRIDPQGTPGWVVIGARLQREFSANWQASITLDNLLDQRYRVHGSGLDAPGRNVIISARFHW
jgi:outer membrane receptor protein involved in Fe transport